MYVCIIHRHTLLTMLYLTFVIVILLGVENKRKKCKHLKIHLMWNEK